MPQIIITTTDSDREPGVEVHRERVNPSDVDTDTSSQLLVERIGWALSDAEQLEADRPPPGRLSSHPRPGAAALAEGVAAPARSRAGYST